MQYLQRFRHKYFWYGEHQPERIELLLNILINLSRSAFDFILASVMFSDTKKTLSCFTSAGRECLSFFIDLCKSIQSPSDSSSSGIWGSISTPVVVLYRCGGSTSSSFGSISSSEELDVVSTSSCNCTVSATFKSCSVLDLLLLKRRFLIVGSSMAFS